LITIGDCASAEAERPSATAPDRIAATSFMGLPPPSVVGATGFPESWGFPVAGLF
jgi:hypothetical protein